MDVLRLDQIDPWLSGNKPLKLQGWLQQFRCSGKRALLSFGGPHSNHLHALAYLAFRQQLPARLVVRGYAHLPLTPTLQDCRHWQAQLQFAGRVEYQRRYDPDYQQQLARQYDALVIPEGGAGAAGAAGCQGLAQVACAYDEVWLAVGSGTTALGLAAGLAARKAQTRLVGVNAVADQGERQRHWQQQMPAGVCWELIDGARGGFARADEALLALIGRYDEWQLPLEPVYTAKLLAALEPRLPALEGRRILLVHSGGLQGRRGYGLSVPDAVLGRYAG